jgi:hypothetical protein
LSLFDPYVLLKIEKECYLFTQIFEVQLSSVLLQHFLISLESQEALDYFTRKPTIDRAIELHNDSRLSHVHPVPDVDNFVKERVVSKLPAGDEEVSVRQQ